MGCQGGLLFFEVLGKKGRQRRDLRSFKTEGIGRAVLFVQGGAGKVIVKRQPQPLQRKAQHRAGVVAQPPRIKEKRQLVFQLCKVTRQCFGILCGIQHPQGAQAHRFRRALYRLGFPLLCGNLGKMRGTLIPQGSKAPEFGGITGAAGDGKGAVFRQLQLVKILLRRRIQKAQIIREAVLPLFELEAVEHLVRHAGGKADGRQGVKRDAPDGDALSLVFDGGIAEEAVVPREKLPLQADPFFIVQGEWEAVVSRVQGGKIQSVKLLCDGLG